MRDFERDIIPMARAEGVGLSLFSPPFFHFPQC